MNALFVALLAQCETHVRRMRRAMEYFRAKLPLNPDELRRLDDEAIAVLDQFTTRFAKLQDTMGAKLFPAVLELTREPGDFPAYLDKLDRLEKIGALPSADEWLEMREIQAATLNRAFVAAQRLVEILQHVNIFSQPYLARDHG